MPREKNDVVGMLNEVGDTTINVNGVVYRVPESNRKFLKYYKPGDRVYVDLKDDTVSFMMEYEKWRAKFPDKAQRREIADVGIETAKTIAETIANNTPKQTYQSSNREDMELMKSAAACATGVIKSMIERGWFGAANDDTPMDKVRPTLNQLMHAIYLDQRQILRGTEE